MDYFEQIEAYKNNQLSESDRIAFEKEMEQNASLKQAVSDHDAAMDVIGSILEGEIRDVINNERLKINNDDEGEESDGGAGDDARAKKDSGVVRQMNWMRWASAAAVVFVLGWWGVSQLGTDDSALYSKVYREASWMTERSGNESDIAEAISKYLSGNTLEGKSELKSIGSQESAYWLAEIYFKEEKFDSTLMNLPVIEFATNKNKRDRMHYLNILSLYFGGEKEKAKAAFSTLPNDTDSFYDPIYSELAF